MNTLVPITNFMPSQGFITDADPGFGFWHGVEVTVHTLGAGEAVVVGEQWPLPFYYRFCVTSVFILDVQHRHMFCHTSAY
jgi:hypothetical protein